jgi:hypothetical protein
MFFSKMTITNHLGRGGRGLLGGGPGQGGRGLVSTAAAMETAAEAIVFVIVGCEVGTSSRRLEGR